MLFTLWHEPRRLPVEKYLSKQGRFTHVKEAEIKRIQKDADDEWKKLKYKESRTI
jgi:pyruvate/2-oxoacid:ferredoxin oxidoreductase beta subunit